MILTTRGLKWKKDLNQTPDADGWQLSTPAFMLYAAHKASLEIVEEAGWEKIQAKRELLNDWLWFLLNDLNNNAKKK